MITIDQDKVIVEEEGQARREYRIGSKEAFAILSRLWLRSGWDTKYVYSFSWLGRPMIQLPEDMMRAQEVWYSVKPDVIVETGIAHGGSLVFYASLCRATSRGRVVGVDVEIRPHNRAAIERHELYAYITLIEGSSIDKDVFAQVCDQIKLGDTVLVMLDSNHSRDHVLAELELYGTLVTPGSYIVAADGIMADLAGAPRSKPDWTWNNPKQAAHEFCALHPEFRIEEPPFPFNEGEITGRVTYWPNAWIRRVA